MAEERDKDKDRELIEAIYREKVERARRTPPEEKFWDGPRLYDMVRGRMESGIRHQYPDADESRVSEILWERLGILERLRGGYKITG